MIAGLVGGDPVSRCTGNYTLLIDCWRLTLAAGTVQQHPTGSALPVGGMVHGGDSPQRDYVTAKSAGSLSSIAACHFQFSSNSTSGSLHII